MTEPLDVEVLKVVGFKPAREHDGVPVEREIKYIKVGHWEDRRRVEISEEDFKWLKDMLGQRALLVP